MTMERRSESYNAGSYDGAYGGSYGTSSYGDTHEGQYQMKQYKASKSRPWDMGMHDPEMKRRKRVASYKVFTVEGKVKASVRNSIRWIKNKYIDLRYGWW